MVRFEFFKFWIHDDSFRLLGFLIWGFLWRLFGKAFKAKFRESVGISNTYLWVFSKSFLFELWRINDIVGHSFNSKLKEQAGDVLMELRNWYEIIGQQFEKIDLWIVKNFYGDLHVLSSFLEIFCHNLVEVEGVSTI